MGAALCSEAFCSPATPSRRGCLSLGRLRLSSILVFGRLQKEPGATVQMSHQSLPKAYFGERKCDAIRDRKTGKWRATKLLPRSVVLFCSFLSRLLIDWRSELQHIAANLALPAIRPASANKLSTRPPAHHVKHARFLPSPAGPLCPAVVYRRASKRRLRPRCQRWPSGFLCGLQSSMRALRNDKCTNQAHLAPPHSAKYPSSSVGVSHPHPLPRCRLLICHERLATGAP